MLTEAARRLADLRVSVIDLNFGCPKKRIMGKHACGAALLRDPHTVGMLVAATVRGAGGIPVTAKMRLGPSIDARTAVDVARAAEANGAAAITVHGRTADENYGVPSRYDLIGEVVRAVTRPRHRQWRRERRRLGIACNGDQRRRRRDGRTRVPDPPLGVPRDHRRVARRTDSRATDVGRATRARCCDIMPRWSSATAIAGARCSCASTRAATSTASPAHAEVPRRDHARGGLARVSRNRRTILRRRGGTCQFPAASSPPNSSVECAATWRFGSPGNAG